jgi:hypothetical protein
MAGVYMEAIGRPDQAEKYYANAGNESSRKLQKLFN